MRVQTCISDRRSSNCPGEPFTLRTSSRQPVAHATKDGQPQPLALREIALGHVARAVQGTAPGQIEQLAQVLPCHLYEATRITNLTDLPRYQAALAGISPELMTREPYVNYLLPEPYYPYPPNTSIPIASINYAIGRNLRLSGNNGAVQSISGPNDFRIFFGTGNSIFQRTPQVISLNADTPYENKAAIMQALNLAAIAAEQGLGEPLGKPQQYCIR
jgi:hypothetical protein